jgi:hypothetical protein
VGNGAKIIQIFDINRETPKKILDFCSFALIPGGNNKSNLILHANLTSEHKDKS